MENTNTSLPVLEADEAARELRSLLDRMRASKSLLNQAIAEVVDFTVGEFIATAIKAKLEEAEDEDRN